jgi:phosphoglycolate phosphatase-like HAD superfamily hydrolase
MKFLLINLKKYSSILYKNIIFDCDGVLLNSNGIKMDAFNRIAISFGEEAAMSLNNYHKLNTGVSRYEKFSYFMNEILPTLRPDIVVSDPVKLKKSLLAKFSHIVVDKLLECEVAPRLKELRQATPETRWFIVSGGDQAELREVFEQRVLAHYFDGGIYGSPKDKHSILADLLKTEQIQRPALFLGDSRLDHEVAKAFDLDFIFVYQWTEFVGWREYCKKHQIRSVHSISDLLNL